MVLEVVPQYGMLEVTSKGRLEVAARAAGRPTSADTGVFLQPVTTATAGWLSETLIAPLDRQISAYEQDKAAAEHAEPPEPYVVSPWETEVRQRRGSFLQIDQLTDDSGNKVLSQGAHLDPPEHRHRAGTQRTHLLGSAPVADPGSSGGTADPARHASR